MSSFKYPVLALVYFSVVTFIIKSHSHTEVVVCAFVLLPWNENMGEGRKDIFIDVCDIKYKCVYCDMMTESWNSGTRLTTNSCRSYAKNVQILLYFTYQTKVRRSMAI
jgi:hypothetical protein